MDESKPLSIEEQIVADTSDFMVSSSRGEEAARSGFRQSEIVARNISNIYDTVASDRALIELTTRNADIKAQAATLRAANAAGVDPSISTDVLTTKLAQRKQISMEMGQAVADVRHGTEGSGFDNLISSFSLPGKMARVNNLTAQYNGLTNEIDQINKSVQQTAVTQSVLKESITTASAVASSRIVAAEATVAARKAEIDAIKYNTQAITVASEASKDRLAALYNASNSKRAEEQLNLGYAHLELSRENAAANRELRKLEIDARAESKGVDEYTLETINLGRSSRGAPEIAGNQAKSMLALFKAGGAGSKEMYIDFENGSRTKMTGVPMLGSSPGEAVTNLTAMPAAIPEAMTPVVEMLKDARKLVSASPKFAGEKDIKKIEEAISSLVSDQVKIQYAKIVPNSNNIFDVGDLASYIQLSAVRNLPVVSSVLAPLAANKQPLSDPKQVLSFVTKAVSDGAITSSQAQDLATVYQAAAAINIQARRLLSVGIIPPNAGRNYNAPATYLGGTVDMTDPTAVGRALSQSLAFKMTKFGGGKTGRGLGAPTISNLME